MLYLCLASHSKGSLAAQKTVKAKYQTLWFFWNIIYILDLGLQYILE